MTIATTQVQDLTLAAVIEAANRIAGLAVQTPLKPSSELSRRTGSQVFLKMENMQDTGSFKIRGAANAILHAQDKADFHGVVAVKRHGGQRTVVVAVPGNAGLEERGVGECVSGTEGAVAVPAYREPIAIDELSLIQFVDHRPEVVPQILNVVVVHATLHAEDRRVGFDHRVTHQSQQ